MYATDEDDLYCRLKEKEQFMYDVQEAEEVEENSRMRRILATAVGREFIQTYMELFKQAGIEIVSVSSAHACAVRLLMKSPRIMGTNCIVQLYDGQEMISILFVKGTYFYSQRNRIFADKHTSEYIRETSEIVSRILQFAAAQQAEETKQTLEHIASYPTINTELTAQIQSCIEGTSVQMSIKSFSRDSGHTDCGAYRQADPESGAVYVHKE